MIAHEQLALPGTNVGSIVGVLGIGIGWWWVDGAAALFISGGILRDGIKNTVFAVLDLMDVSEVFIVPEAGVVSLSELAEATKASLQLNWKLQDIVLIPVTELPPMLRAIDVTSTQQIRCRLWNINIMRRSAPTPESWRSNQSRFVLRHAV